MIKSCTNLLSVDYRDSLFILSQDQFILNVVLLNEHWG